MDRLTEVGVRDSKVLSRLQRETLKEHIEAIVDDYEIVAVPPSKIDSCNMNTVELNETVKLINKLGPDQVFVDALGSNPDAYGRRIRSLLSVNTKVHLVVENGADGSYPIVGAASILAKVARDRMINLIEEEYGPLGSGYPSDPRTVDFLRRYLRIHGDFPDVVRRKWSTVQRLQKAREASRNTD